jgi:uncharacterized coiled-coil DUF342 family protein
MKMILMVMAIALTNYYPYAHLGEWKEMQDFHELMSKSFHPAEENNLKPLKENAAALEAAAVKWQTSAVPKGYNAVVTKPILDKLVKELKALHVAVKQKKPDASLKEMITSAHNTFHEIMEKCRDGEKH